MQRYRVALVVCNKLLLTLIWLFCRLPEFGDMAELPSKSQQKFVAEHQCHPVEDCAHEAVCHVDQLLINYSISSIKLS